MDIFPSRPKLWHAVEIRRLWGYCESDVRLACGGEAESQAHVFTSDMAIVCPSKLLSRRYQVNLLGVLRGLFDTRLGSERLAAHSLGGSGLGSGVFQY